MDEIVSEEENLEVDIEAGDCVVDEVSASGEETCNERLEDKADKNGGNLKLKKSRKALKPPRHPKGPSLTANDHKLIKEISQLALRKRARIQRMKTLRRIKASSSSSSSLSSSMTSSPYITILAMIVTVLFFVFLIFQGFFATDSSFRSDESQAPNLSPNNQVISVEFYNNFAPETSLRYSMKAVSGSDNKEE